jgi:transposase
LELWNSQAGSQTSEMVSAYPRYFTQTIPDSDPSVISNVVGIDLGMNFLTDSFGSDHQTTFVSERFIKHKRAHYKAVRKSLQQYQTPSARRRLKAIGPQSRSHYRVVDFLF